MRRPGQVLVLLAGAAAVWGAGPVAVPGVAGSWAARAFRGVVPAGEAGAAGSWGRAMAVPGLRALNRGRDADVSSVSCPSPGNCAAGGYYRLGVPLGGYRGFVVDERHGRWGRAIRVPGLAALSAGRQSSVDSVSCFSAGNCAAGGDSQGLGHQGFAVVERSGRWGRAVKLPGPVSSVSCGSAGGCAAGGQYGQYAEGAGRLQGFVVTEKNGRWGRAAGVPGLAALNTGGIAGIDSVSCGSAGSCAAGGHYRNHGRQGFVAVEKNGVWGQAIEVPGLAALNTGGRAEVYSVSCTSAGNCAAGGGYTDSHGGYQGFVVSEQNGTWGQATEVPGLGTLNAAHPAQYAYVWSVSCASPGNCAAGGSVGRPAPSGFVASEKNGVWGQAILMPGPGSGITAQDSAISSVSCARTGNCAASGTYEALSNAQLAFVALERNGAWSQATRVPGLAALTQGFESADSVSCAPAGKCTAAGSYPAHHGPQGFVT